jgi:uncharacterized protein
VTSILEPRLAALAALVFVAFFAQGLTGFGATVIALALGAQLYPLQELLPTLIILSLASATTIAGRGREAIDRDLLVRQILPRTGAGLVLGFAVASFVPAGLLERGYGALVFGLAAVELLAWARGIRSQLATTNKTRAPQTGDDPRSTVLPCMAGAQTGDCARSTEVATPSWWPGAPAMLAAGIVHGICASGGPLLVYAVVRAGLQKSAVRATLAAVWVALNGALVVAFAAAGKFEAVGLERAAVLAPVVAIALVAGDRAHGRVAERPFRAVVLGLLLLSGVSLGLREELRDALLEAHGGRPAEAAELRRGDAP